VTDIRIATVYAPRKGLADTNVRTFTQLGAARCCPQALPGMKRPGRRYHRERS
jgi:hypothetical protein